MRRFVFVLVLVVMAPLVAEVLPGSTPLTMPGLLLVDLLIYGPGALLIRELVRRRGRGWASILLLGAAYGMIEEGLALQSLFDPSYTNVALWGDRMFGVNWVYACVVILWIHPVWSVAIPILLTELLFPTQRTLPSLGWFGLIGTLVWYVLGVALLGLFTRTISPYHVSPILSGAVILIALMLAVGALFVLPRQVPRVKYPRNVPKPWSILLLTGISAFIGLGVPALLWHILPAMTQFPRVLVPLLVPLIMAVGLIWAVQHWAHSSHWNDLHLLSLVSGLLIAHTVVGALLFSKTILQAVAIAVVGLVMVILLVLFALLVRRREAKPFVSVVPTVVTPIRPGEQSQT